MRSYPVAGLVLVVSMGAACGGRADLIGSAAGTRGDDGAGADASVTDGSGLAYDTNAADGAGSSADSSAAVGTCAPVEGGTIAADETDGGACSVPTRASIEVGYGNCSLVSTGGGCRASEYQLTCGDQTPQQLFDSLGCTTSPIGVHQVLACCPCGGPPEVCTTIDVAAYDRSCTNSEDCMTIASGRQCNLGCLCADTAVSISGMSQYQQSIACLPILGVCNCPAEGVACCIHGRCTTTFMRCPDWG